MKLEGGVPARQKKRKRKEKRWQGRRRRKQLSPAVVAPVVPEAQPRRLVLRVAAATAPQMQITAVKRKRELAPGRSTDFHLWKSSGDITPPTYRIGAGAQPASLGGSLTGPIVRTEANGQPAPFQKCISTIASSEMRKAGRLRRPLL